MRLAITLDLDNAAFDAEARGDHFAHEEVERVIMDALERLDGRRWVPLIDLNGNTVGEARLIDAEPLERHPSVYATTDRAEARERGLLAKALDALGALTYERDGRRYAAIRSDEDVTDLVASVLRAAGRDA